MKNQIIKYTYAFLVVLFLFTACESEDENGGVSTSITPATHYPGENGQELFWVNGGVSGPGKDRDVTITGSVIHIPMAKEGDTYRQELGLEGKSIMGFFGANYNQDGSQPDKASEMPNARWVQNPEFDHLYDRNYVVTSFVFVDSAKNANAKLIIEESFTLENRGLNIWRDNYMEVISGKVTVQILDKSRTDDVPPLGKNPDNTVNESFTFTAREITARDYGNISSDLSGTSPDINMIDIKEAFAQQGNELYIQIIETVIEHGDNLTIYQPTLN